MKGFQVFLFLCSLALIGVGLFLILDPALFEFSFRLSDYQYQDQSFITDDPITHMTIDLEGYDVTLMESTMNEIQFYYSEAPSDPIEVVIGGDSILFRHTLSDTMNFIRDAFYDRDVRQIAIHIPSTQLSTLDLDFGNGDVILTGLTISERLTINVVASTLMVMEITAPTFEIDGVDSNISLSTVNVPLVHEVLGDRIEYTAMESTFRDASWDTVDSSLFFGTVAIHTLTVALHDSGDCIAEGLEITDALSAQVDAGFIYLDLAQPLSSIDQVNLYATMGSIQFEDNFADYSFSDSLGGYIDITASADFDITITFNPS